MALRAWAIATLGRLFTYDVAIQPGHWVVTSGPYRWVRHPSYAGAQVAFLGLGVTLESGVSVLALPGVPLVALLIRIWHEERTLRRELGEQYEAYTAKTSRLIPRIW